MKFTPMSIAGAFIVDIEPRYDERGFFARTWCENEFAEQGLVGRFVQCNLSHNTLGGTLRGLHYQASPAAEVKIVSCTRGAAFDVLVDLRPDSPSHREWQAVELSELTHRAVYIPEGVAHGFQTLADDTTLFYMMSAFYDAGAARGVRWDDPVLDIQWPMPPTCISARDRALPCLAP
jgi:dTDP-4-dehydrorhamnose 3,5-epimerase